MKHNDRLIQMNLEASPRKHHLSPCTYAPPSRHAITTRVEHLVALTLAQHITVLLERAAGELGLLPQVGSQEAVGVGDGGESSLERVLERLGGAGGGGVGVVDTGKLEQALDGWGGD